MSHSPERADKNCLNCGALVVGRYCHVCGQENVEPKESAAQIAAHFFADLTHFDGKFFVTLKDLIAKPGFLSKEYAAGRRASYVNPIRFYLFTSAIFFLVFFSFFHVEKDVPTQMDVNGKSLEEIAKMDSSSFAGFTAGINKADDRPAVPMTRKEFAHYADSVGPVSGFYFTPSHYKSRAEYDSLLASGRKSHNWIERQLIYKEIELNDKYHHNPKGVVSALSNAFLHSLPQMLFISLPLLALLLKLLYIRRKQFYYVSHFIFSVHLYIFLFIAMAVVFGLSRLNGALHWTPLRFLSTLLWIWMLAYAYLAMKKVYGQGWGKTFVKFLLLLLLFFFLMVLLFFLLALFSLFKI